MTQEEYCSDCRYAREDDIGDFYCRNDREPEYNEEFECWECAKREWIEVEERD